ncbi:hypothetical protein [Nesterenkonia xinjiangensis]|uniref:Uncharacterized protein n=1 Tax=Nesterenkonia xinjiangensis TaxID=225327 RepID=A0A7Z0KA19_9MICC|nr:hypothetical protein [Nesterenkonia xinjiangensis]NYJ78363.1 hypothetical protein [Nesterenkonia xinjiangensis]
MTGFLALGFLALGFLALGFLAGGLALMAGVVAWGRTFGPGAYLAG